MNNPQRSDSPVVSCFASVLLQGLLTPIEMYWAQPREPLYPGGLDFAICFPTVRHLPSQDSLFLEPVMLNGDSLNRGTSFTMSFSCPSSCGQRKGHWPSRSQLSTCSVLNYFQPPFWAKGGSRSPISLPIALCVLLHGMEYVRGDFGFHIEPFQYWILNIHPRWTFY